MYKPRVHSGILRNCRAILVLVGTMSLFACSEKPGKKDKEKLFTMLPSEQTGIKFENKLISSARFNIYKYRNYYNGGGIAIGDINNDGLADIYLTANEGTNKLFLNEGEFHFRDITEKAGVEGKKGWSTGVAMADVNGDGLLDIYVCNSGNIEGDDRKNELFINKGDLNFEEQAHSYGLDDGGLSTHASFFDYDKDGDLDMYLLNNSFQAIGSLDPTINRRDTRDPLGGDKLFRNDEGRFTDVSEKAGILGCVVAFGLGITTGDFNNDSWMDMYISNDFFERDYLYMNNGDGTFSEQLEGQMRSISAASMGADAADINNDGRPDIFVTDMLPGPNHRIKTVTTFESWEKYSESVENGYYHQFTRNMLHLNNGDNTFSEIGRLAGVEATDWSWGALIADFDNDGLKDIFVANGIYQDLTNQDYLQFISNRETMRAIISDSAVDFDQLIDAIPSVKVSNYMFKNNGGLDFSNKAGEWGLDTPGFSNGSAYGDLDNDGDLDLVVNNVNMPLFVYRNETNILNPSAKHIGFSLRGKGKNTFAIGTKITLYLKNSIIYYEHMPIRGFQSSMDYKALMGLGKNEIVDSLIVQWPLGGETKLFDQKSGQIIGLTETDPSPGLFTQVKARPPQVFTQDSLLLGGFTHLENEYNDFERERLLFHMRTNEGPKISVADVNGDGQDDVFIGGAKGSPAKMLVQASGENFRVNSDKVFASDMISEDMGSVFFDADNDGDNDLYVTSGSLEFSGSSPALTDRLYINDGKGNFSRHAQPLPTFRYECTSVAVPSDYDNDGDLDLFVGVRAIPFAYGVPASSYLLENDGKGNFTNRTKEHAPGLEKAGLVTDAVWADTDLDGDEDLMIAGEWMPLRLFVNDNGVLTEKTDGAGLGRSSGLWNCIEAVDIDNDGDMDFVAGNIGRNSRIRAIAERPAYLYVNDFDRNGSAEQLLCIYNLDNNYPLALKHDLTMQLPGLEKKYPDYETFKNETVEDIFTPDQLSNGYVLKISTTATSLIMNNGNGSFSLIPLPGPAQFTPVYAISAGDYDSDGRQDIILGGNQYRVKPEMGRYDAGFGVFLKGDGAGGFEAVPAIGSGLYFVGEIRDLKNMVIGEKTCLVAVRNNAAPQVFIYNK